MTTKINTDTKQVAVSKITADQIAKVKAIKAKAGFRLNQSAIIAEAINNTFGHLLGERKNDTQIS